MEWNVPVVKDSYLVGPERGSCSAHYNSNTTFREEGLGSKQDMADREVGPERCLWRGSWEESLQCESLE